METTVSRTASGTFLRRGRASLGQSQLYQKITRGSLYLLCFLTPLFFLPWTGDVLELNKQTLLIILSFVALVAWLGGMVVEKRMSIQWGWLNLLPLLYLVSVLLSSIFSLAGYQTWVGQQQQEYTSFLTLTTFVLLFFTVVNSAGHLKVQRNILFTLLLSGTLSALITVLSVFNIFLFPFPFARVNGFNTVGNINNFLFFLSVLMILGLGLWLVSQRSENDVFHQGVFGTLSRVMIVVLTVFNLAFLVSIDFWVLWVVNMLGIVVLITFAFVQKNFLLTGARLALPFLVLLISILLLFIRTPLNLNLPVTVSPGYQLSAAVVKSVLSEGGERLFFGSGPGTFVFDYTKYKAQSLNATQFWNFNFSGARSHVLTLLATEGVGGVVLWGAFVVVLAALVLKRLLKDTEKDDWKFTYALFASWIVLILATFLYSSNLTLQFLFWLLSGLLASQVIIQRKETDFGKSPKLGFAFSFLFVLLSVGVITALFVAGERYASEVAYAKAIRLNNEGAAVDDVIRELTRAVSYNSLNDVYYRNLSIALLNKLIAVLQQTSAESISTEQTRQAQGIVNAMLSAAQRAVQTSPNYVVNYSTLGRIYREIIPIVNNANVLALQALQRASELEPVNPRYHTNIGRVHLIVAERAKRLQGSDNKELASQARELEVSSLKSAEEAFNKSIELKSDFAPAHYYLAVTFERQGRLSDAVTRMQALRNTYPLDIGVGFQLGVLYIRQKEYDKARIELERVVELRPNYSNALWYLSFIYEEQDNVEEAIKQVEKIQELNPDNALVAERLQELKTGKKSKNILNPLEQEETVGKEQVIDTEIEEEEETEGDIE